MSEVGEIKTVRVGDRLIITDGVGPLRYVDLVKNKVVVYKPPKPGLKRRLLRLIHRQPFEDALYYQPGDGFIKTESRPNIMNILQVATKIPVQYWEEIDEHEFTTLATGQKILARDVTTQPSMSSIPPILLWNGKKRVIKNAGGKCYLITTI